jgi:ubiquinone/menaquinone biosynthesis C-methylase UbiE
MKARIATLLLAIFFAFPAFPALPAPPALPAYAALLAYPALLASPAQQTGKRLFPPLSLGVLEGPDRVQWNKPDLIMDALNIADGSVVADLGAGGGWFTIHLARRVGPNGRVYAEDIQPLMIDALSRRVRREGFTNVETVVGTATDPKLPAGSLDAVLIADAYHEMNDPARPEVIQTLLGNIARSLKPQGRLGVVAFLPGGGGPGPALEERVDPDSVTTTMTAAGLTLEKREVVPPFLYLLVFGKSTARADSR